MTFQQDADSLLHLSLRLVLVHYELGVYAVANVSHHYLQCKAFPILTHGQAKPHPTANCAGQL